MKFLCISHLPVNGRSVPASWVTWYCKGVNFSFKSFLNSSPIFELPLLSVAVEDLLPSMRYAWDNRRNFLMFGAYKACTNFNSVEKVEEDHHCLFYWSRLSRANRISDAWNRKKPQLIIDRFFLCNHFSFIILLSFRFYIDWKLWNSWRRIRYKWKQLAMRYHQTLVKTKVKHNDCDDRNKSRWSHANFELAIDLNVLLHEITWSYTRLN